MFWNRWVLKTRRLHTLECLKKVFEVQTIVQIWSFQRKCQNQGSKKKCKTYTWENQLRKMKIAKLDQWFLSLVLTQVYKVNQIAFQVILVECSEETNQKDKKHLLFDPVARWGKSRWLKNRSRCLILEECESWRWNLDNWRRRQKMLRRF